MTQQDSSSQNRWISSLELRNFQLHKDTRIDFSPGLNVITGGNHRGKSSVMRAIQYLVTCRPTTEIDGLIRWGKRSLFIKLTMNDGSWVIREKGKDVNHYIVYDARKGGDPLTFSGFGTTPPDEVTEALGMGLVSFGTKKNVFLNLSQQDEVFLIGEGETEMARWMYSITNLHDIRGAMENAMRECKGMAEQVKESDTRISGLQKKIDDMPDLEMLMMAAQSNEEIKDQIAEELAEVMAMEALFDGMASLKNKALPVKRRVDEGRSLMSEVSPKLATIAEEMEVLSELVTLDDRISSIEQDIVEIRSRDRSLVQKRRIDVSEVLGDADEIGRMIDILEEIERADANVETSRAKVTKSELHKDEITGMIRELEGEMFGDDHTCPLCGQSVEGDIVSHIVSEGGDA